MCYVPNQHEDNAYGFVECTHTKTKFKSNLCSNFITVSLLDFITVSWLDLDKENGTLDRCLRMMHSHIIGCTCAYTLQSHV